MQFDIIFNKSVVLVRGFKGNILCFFISGLFSL